MGPRRTAAKTAVVAAAEFNFDDFLADFERPEFTRDLFRKGKLAPKLKTLEDQLDELDTRIDRLERAAGEDGSERDITAVDPLAELERRREVLTVQYNELATEFNESAVSFTFRIPDDKDDKARIDDLMASAAVPEPVRPDVEGLSEDEAAAAQEGFTAEFSVWWDALMLRSMSVTCISHELTVAQWESLRDRVGMVAFNGLSNAWAEAVQAAKPNAPFLLRPSHTPITEE